MQVNEGKYYITVSGRLVGPALALPWSIAEFICDTGENRHTLYRGTGRCYRRAYSPAGDLAQEAPALLLLLTGKSV